MAREVKCDICRKPTEKIVGKLFFAPIVQGARTFHSKYSHHADVGICCKDRLLRGFDFRERTSAEEYHERRRVRAV